MRSNRLWESLFESENSTFYSRRLAENGLSAYFFFQGKQRAFLLNGVHPLSITAHFGASSQVMILSRELGLFPEPISGRSHSFSPNVSRLPKRSSIVPLFRHGVSSFLSVRYSRGEDRIFFFSLSFSILGAAPINVAFRLSTGKIYPFYLYVRISHEQRGNIVRGDFFPSSWGRIFFCSNHRKSLADGLEM